MKEEDLKNIEKRGDVEYLKEEKPPSISKAPAPEVNINDLINLLRTVKRYRTTAPTLTPRNFLEQIEIYDDGTDLRLYVWVNQTNGWKSVTLS